jgi:protein TonB
MTTGYPLPLAPGAPALGASDVSSAAASQTPIPSSARYDVRPRSRGLVALAMLVSVGVHLVLFFGFAPTKKKATPRAPEQLFAIRLQLPKLEELEEPEPEPNDGGRSEEVSLSVPMQADVPQLVKPNDFVQQLDFSSLLEKPDLSNATLLVIPENIRRGGKIDHGVGAIFNLADLDRAPEPVFQPSPVIPFPLRRDGISGEVRVQFVVSTEGRVLNAFVVETTDVRFNDAAISGVMKWKFKAGIRGGQKVNTRMAVPIVFTLLPAAE